MVEEVSEDEIRAELETNLLGALWVTQSALPILRAQRSGHIIQVTSEGGIRAFPEFGAYHASKWGLEGLSESLAQEVASFGIHVTCLEPGPYATDFGPGSLRRSNENPDYDQVRDSIRVSWQPGDPTATRAAILQVVDAEKPPLRILFGRSLDAVTDEYHQRLATWNEWQPVSLAAYGEPSALSAQ
jgi:NAD(P)-dependent dehydrogenase (short-subunit alcohol dehydrogenase family)